MKRTADGPATGVPVTAIHGYTSGLPATPKGAIATECHPSGLERASTSTLPAKKEPPTEDRDVGATSGR